MTGARVAACVWGFDVDDAGVVWWVSCAGQPPQSLAAVARGQRVGEAMGWQIWQLSAALPLMDALLPPLLVGEVVRGAALVESDHPLDDLWWAAEWRGASSSCARSRAECRGRRTCEMVPGRLTTRRN